MSITQLNLKVIKELNGTRKKLRDVCEDLGLDYEDITSEELGIDQCTQCGIWEVQLILDLDENPICTICAETVGI